MPHRRGNSLVRGSGHSFHGYNKNRDSILKRQSIVSGKKIEEEAAVFDLVLLTTIDEANVIRNISNMYYEDHIYCYIGNVVISMNPFKDLPIYDEATIAKYRGRSAFDPKLAPHIFALADNVFSDMTFRGRDQVVIISGESGAGKTEAAKKVMMYIAAVSKEGPKVNEIKDKLLTTNPLLESFGNAKTTRNDNSSRFGKYMDIQFDFKGNPCGGVITTYLLEKARVTRLADGERNFHIFYQLLAGGRASKFGMKSDPKAYAFLKQGETKARGINDKSWFGECTHGFQAIGFSEEETTSLWQSIAAVLMLGNVTFKSDGKDGSRLADRKAAAACEPLIGTTVDKIEAALTHNTVVAQGDLVAADLNPDKASSSRDTLCKAMYQRLFIWMCKRINQSIAVDPKEIKAVIGVLDIYGFEVFQFNSFEQFCINYCNEKLQQLFIELTLKTEQDEYVAEGITWEPIEYFNNKVICDLIDSKRRGIVATLDEEAIRPGDKSDEHWLENMTKTIGQHDHLVVAKGPQDKVLPRNAFMLKHYAGDVTYSIDGFLDKNTDTLFKDLGQLMFESSNPVLKSCFPEGDKKTWKGAAKRPKTAGRMFIESMDQMIELLNTKAPSYIRCIKPNQTRSAHKIEDELMQHQVQYLGLVENVRVRRAGFCFRETYKDFLWRYRILSPNTFPRWRGTDKAGCVEIFKALGIRDKNYQLGKTKIFIKHPQVVFRIEEERDMKVDEVATRLQMAWRRYVVSRTIFSYFEGIRKSFQPVLTLDGRNPVYGYSPSRVRWPKATPQFAASSDFLKKVYGIWWAQKMVGPLPKDQQQLMRLQLLGHTLFAGKKDGFSITKSQMGVTNHVGSDLDPTGSHAEQFAAQRGDILFACPAVKISKHRKPSDRIVIMTSNALYRTDKWKVKAGRFGAYDEIESVVVSGNADGVVVLRGTKPGTDVVLNVGSTDTNLVYAFVANLIVNAKNMKHHPKVTVLAAHSNMVVNNSGKPGPKKEKVVKIVKDPAEVAGTRWNSGTKSFMFA